MRLQTDNLSPKLRKWLWVFVALCVGVTVLDLVVAGHGDHWWSFFGFFSLYGFVACVVLVLVATRMRRWLMRAENHYEAADKHHGENPGEHHGEHSGEHHD